MVKNKATAMDIDVEKIPKKQLSDMKTPPEEQVEKTAKKQHSDLKKPRSEDELVVSTTAKKKATAMDIDVEKVPKKKLSDMKTPPEEDVEKIPKEITKKNPSSVKKPPPEASSLSPSRPHFGYATAVTPTMMKETIDLITSVDEDEALLEASGLTLGIDDDDDIKDASVKFARIGNSIVVRVKPGYQAKTCYPDYKLYAMFMAWKDKTRTDFDLSWMKKFHMELTYLSWFNNGVPVPSTNPNFNVRLYVMTWKEGVSDEQAMILARIICRKVNEFVVNPEKQTDKADTPLVISDINNPRKLFWIEDGVWNDVVSNFAALQRMNGECHGSYADENFFVKNEAIISRYFRKGTLDIDTKKKLKAPDEWLRS